MDFTVTLSGVSASVVSISYTTINGTAIAGTDYTQTSGTLQIPAGQTTGLISVPILGNTTYQADRTFTVQITLNAVNSTATGTILDDDLPANVQIASVARVNNDSTVQVSSATGLKYTLYYTNMTGITAPVSQWSKQTAVNGTGAAITLTHTTSEDTQVYVIGVSR